MVKNMSKKAMSIITKIGISILILLVTFYIIATILDLLYVKPCERRLKPVANTIPQELQTLGVTLRVEPYGKETKLFTFSYRDSAEQWARNSDTLNAIGPTFVAADIDGDKRAELIIFQGWLVTSKLMTSPCSPHGKLDFSVIYDVGNTELSASCTPPPSCSFYLSEEYTGLFPGIDGTIVLIAIGGALLISTLCVIGYFSYWGYRWYHNRRKSAGH
jgi:hypothetical protein